MAAIDVSVCPGRSRGVAGTTQQEAEADRGANWKSTLASDTCQPIKKPPGKAEDSTDGKAEEKDGNEAPQVQQSATLSQNGLTEHLFTAKDSA